jgi:hypothetical protein
MIPGIELLTSGAVWFVGLLVKVTVVLLVAVTLSLALRRTSAAVRHMVWTAAILSVLALPVLAAVLPWRLPVITVAAPSATVPVAPVATRGVRAAGTCHPRLTCGWQAGSTRRWR